MNDTYLHVYTGNGKGKTTASLGLAIRALGAGHKVFVAQFVKGMRYSEVKALEQFYPNLIIEQYGLGCFIEKQPKADDYEAALNGLKAVKEIVASKKYDVLILDEANIALYFKLFSFEDLWLLIESALCSMEVIVTGRYAPEELIEKADLVTEMHEVKHYYSQGVEARRGVEF